METLESFIQRTITCGTAEALFHAFDQHLARYSIEYSAYFIMAKRLRAIAPGTGLVRQNYPRDYARQYIERNFGKIDPIIQQALKEAEAFHWKDVYDKRPVNAQQEMIFAAHKQAGFVDGIAVPVFGPMGTIAIFSLTGKNTVFDLSRAQLVALQFACLHTHNRYFEIEQINGDDPEKPLSPREMEALSLVADGLANKEIAEKLGVTENTVDTMVRRVFVKFGVNNRISAVLKGIGCGLLLP